MTLEDFPNCVVFEVHMKTNLKGYDGEGLLTGKREMLILRRNDGTPLERPAEIDSSEAE